MTEKQTAEGEVKDPRIAELESEFFARFMKALPHLSGDPATARGLLPLAHHFAEEQARLETEKSEAENRAALDPLLPCFFRHGYFLNRLNEEVIRTTNIPKPDSVLITLDLDNFGAFNKKYGQDNGDKLLLACAAATLKAMRPNDTPGRTGGDEFSVIIYRTTIDGAVAASRRIQAAVINASQALFGSQGWTQTVSIGLCLISPTPKDFSCKGIADQALIASKQAGKEGMKNRISIGIFDPDSGLIKTIIVKPAEQPSPISTHK